VSHFKAITDGADKSIYMLYLTVKVYAYALLSIIKEMVLLINRILLPV